MVIGNPYRFSIITEVIDEWNMKGTNFNNGILLFCIGGEIFQKEIATATLNSEIPQLKEKLMNITVNEELFNMGKEEAFAKMYDITYLEWENNDSITGDYRFYITPQTMEDLGCKVFAVSNADEVRIMSSKLNYITEDSKYDIDNADISEAFITNDELMQIVLKLDTVFGV